MSSLGTPHRSECARAIRERGQAQKWENDQIAEAISDHCSVGMLRAHRLARGWTLEQVATELRLLYARAWGAEPALSHQRVSRWEIGADMPSPKYLDALCRLYRTRPDRLGFGHDYGNERQPSGSEYSLTTCGVAELPIPEGDDRSGLTTEQGATGSQKGVTRCIGSGHDGTGPGRQLFERLRSVRSEADAMLETQSVSAITVDRWERLAEDYALRQPITPLEVFLAESVNDFACLQRTLRQRQPLEFQHRMLRVLAKLAGLIGFDLMGLGALSESHAWYHTARLAADEIGDRSVRAWLMAAEALSYFWQANLLGRTLALCEEAETMAGSRPTPTAAQAASIKARAYARIGQRSHAMVMLQRAEDIFEQLPKENTNGSRFGFSEWRLRYCQQNALTLLGETNAARTVQVQAQDLPHRDSVIETTAIKLDLATCLVRDGEVEEGFRLASRILSGASRIRDYGLIHIRVRQLEELNRALYGTSRAARPAVTRV